MAEPWYPPPALIDALKTYDPACGTGMFLANPPFAVTTELQLYRVTVTQEWTAEADALVLAPDAKTAEKLAEQEVELSADGAEEFGPLAFAKPEPIDDGVLNRMDDDDLWLILPDGEVCGNDRAGLARFRSFITPERLEAMRLARIEAGNGQMSLMGAQA